MCLNLARINFCTTIFIHISREDLRRWGINVSILLPGGHRTDIVSIDGQLHRFRAMWNRLSQDTRDEYGQDWIDTGNL